MSIYRTSIRTVLDELPDVCEVLFTVENAMNMLMVEKQPAIHQSHLPYPRCYPVTFLSNNSVAALMCKNFLFKLNEGCLQVTGGMEKYYQIAHILLRCSKRRRSLPSVMKWLMLSSFEE